MVGKHYSNIGQYVVFVYAVCIWEYFVLRMDGSVSVDMFTTEQNLI